MISLKGSLIMNQTKKIIAWITAKPGKSHELLALLQWLAGESRREPGNLRWDIWQDPSAPDQYILDELYSNEAAVAAHRASPHFATYLGRIAEFADRTAAVLDPVEVLQHASGAP